MSNFDLEQSRLTPAEWREKAAEAADENSAQYLIIGGILGGFIAAAATSFPPTGLLVAGWAFHTAWKRTQLANQNSATIAEYGAVAHCLKGGDFQDFRQQAGDEETSRQLRWARDRGHSLSLDAEEFLEIKESFHSQGGADRGKFQGGSLPQVEEYAPPQLDLLAAIGGQPGHRLIVGVQGSGKGVVVSNALREVKRLHPKLTVFYLDPKFDKKETGYFVGAVDVLKRVKGRTSPVEDVVTWFRECLEEFEEIEGDKLLVFDEATNISGKFKIAGGTDLKWFQDQIRGMVSCGDSEGIKLWILVQNPHTEPLGIDGGLRSQFTPLGIIRDTNIAAYGAMVSTKFLPPGQKVSDEKIQSLCKESAIGRCFYDGATNRWYPMPSLPNYSGYNRDERKSILTPQQEQTRKQLELLWEKDSPTVEVELPDKEKELPSSQMARTVLVIIQSAAKYPTSFDSIRKSRRWEGNSPERESLREALEELIPQWVTGDEERGYSIQE